MPIANKTFTELITFTRASGGTSFRPVSYGAELVTNGDFSGGNTGWTRGGGWSIAGGLATKTAGATTYLENPTAVVSSANAIAKIVLTISGYSAGSLFVNWGASFTTAMSGNGTFTFSVKATAVGSGTAYWLSLYADAAFAGSVSAVSVKEVTLDRAGDPIQLFSAPVNYPRMDYDPVTGEKKGLLIEEQRTNLQRWSNDGANMNQSYAGLGSMTKTLNYAISPDGTQNATRFVMSLNGGTTMADICSIVMPAVSITTNIPYTGTLFVKSNTASSYSMKFLTPDGANVQAVTITPSWTRIECTSTAQSTASGNMRLRIRGAEGTSGSVDISVYGWQLEQAAFSTSYIPTTPTAEATRAADVCSVNTLTPWFNHNAATVVESDIIGRPTGHTNQLLRLVNGGNGLYLYNNSTDSSSINIYDDVNSVNIGNASEPFSSTVKVLAYIDSAKMRVGYAGAISALTSYNGAFANSSSLRIGGDGSWNGHIRKIIHIPKRLTDTQLQDMTLPSDNPSTPSLSLNFATNTATIWEK